MLVLNKDMLWNELRELTIEKEDSEETISWKDLNKMLENMEFEQGVHEARCIKLNEEEMNLAIALERFGNENGGNCYDYLEYIDYKSDRERYIVGIYTEPCGIIGFEGKKLKELLSNIYQLYSSQPKDMSYIEAGHILYFLQADFEDRELNFEEKITDFTSVWKSTK